MNICVVSSFEGNVEDYMSMMAEFQEEMKEAVDSFDVGVVNTDKEGFCKIITMGNVINMDRLQEIMASPKMVEWDTNHKNTDIIYSLERMN
ncbi:hypothetical protein FIM08_00780 [SAR202 cluster bacterium AC-647-N09_OGT_505m]|nr:hypothetical protein [SAR202 cluster bacterium AC-647-N09_OGT_505m]